MKSQPDFPDDEPALPASGCACAICQALRDDVEAERAAALADAATAKQGGSMTPPVGYKESFFQVKFNRGLLSYLCARAARQFFSVPC
jgi:hypothetical protein